MAAEWSTEQLKELMEQRFQGQERAVSAALAAQEKATAAAMGAAERAVLKAEAAADKRFEGVNEFRQTLSDQAALLMPRLEAQAELKAIREVVNNLAIRIERGEGKSAGLGASWGYLLGAVALAGGLAALVSKMMH